MEAHHDMTRSLILGHYHCKLLDEFLWYIECPCVHNLPPINAVVLGNSSHGRLPVELQVGSRLKVKRTVCRPYSIENMQMTFMVISTLLIRLVCVQPTLIMLSARPKVVSSLKEKCRFRRL